MNERTPSVSPDFVGSKEAHSFAEGEHPIDPSRVGWDSFAGEAKPSSVSSRDGFANGSP